MFYKVKIIPVFLLIISCTSFVHAQHTKRYNLAKLLLQNKLDTTAGPQTHLLSDGSKQAISTKGTVWLKGVNFTEGKIDVDLRGKNVFLNSFLGIAFHAKDTSAYDVIYFRPFRFQSTDVPTRKWSVQYMSIPKYGYDILRKEHPGVYENDVNPAPQAEDWFHATIVVRGDSISVYVNHSATASLKVKKLNDFTDGKIGLWSSTGALSSDFADLSITQ